MDKNIKDNLTRYEIIDLEKELTDNYVSESRHKDKFHWGGSLEKCLATIPAFPRIAVHHIVFYLRLQGLVTELNFR